MKKIISFLKPQMEGPDVVDLQAAFQRFLDKGLLLQDDPDTRRELSAGLIAAQASQKFGSWCAGFRKSMGSQLYPRKSGEIGLCGAS